MYTRKLDCEEKREETNIQANVVFNMRTNKDKNSTAHTDPKILVSLSHSFYIGSAPKRILKYDISVANKLLSEKLVSHQYILHFFQQSFPSSSTFKSTSQYLLPYAKTDHRTPYTNTKIQEKYYKEKLKSSQFYNHHYRTTKEGNIKQ